VGSAESGQLLANAANEPPSDPDRPAFFGKNIRYLMRSDGPLMSRRPTGWPVELLRSSKMLGF
jgi:hypothetical protein